MQQHGQLLQCYPLMSKRANTGLQKQETTYNTQNSPTASTKAIQRAVAQLPVTPNKHAAQPA
jgi:hypothetical protein